MADPLDQLRDLAARREQLQAELDALDEQRHALILAARGAGYTLRDIAHAARLSFQRVDQITRDRPGGGT